MLSNPKTQRLATTPILKLIAILSIPSMISMLVQSLYNVVDSIYVAKISEDAITALSYAFPVQAFAMAFGLGLGIGTNSVVSVKLGEQQNEEASIAAQNGLFLSIILGSFFAIFGYAISYVYFKLIIPASEPQIFQQAFEYTAICVSLIIFIYLQILIARTLQATGRPTVPMIAQLIGAISNIAFDPLFIFTFRLEVKGAAIATVLSQLIALTYALSVLKFQKQSIKIFSKTFRPNKKYIMILIKVSLPIAVINCLFSLTITILNIILGAVSKIAVAILGIYFKIQSFVFMPLFGLNQGTMPIFGYSFGADNRNRFNKTFAYSIIISLILSIINTLIIQFASENILYLFSIHPGTETMIIGTQALKIISFSFIPACFSILATATFQAIGRAFTSAVLSLSRQLFILIPIIYMFVNFTSLGLKGAWLAFPISELLTCLLFIPVFIINVNKAFIKHRQLLALEKNSTN